MTARVRVGRRADLAAVYRVCATTDATGLGTPPRPVDDKLPGHVYAGPYLAADPGLTFVVEDDAGVGGYVSATADTVRFNQWLDAHWWPRLRRRYPPGTFAPAGPHRPWFDTHPAHLHIKVARRLQGQGCGRRLMDTVLAALQGRGVAGVHLGVAEANTRAVAFYTALGFTEAHRHAWGSTLVRNL
ncbi:N-acetyltransferase [Dactylosporangium sp. NPDC049742]|uniref:GNAT family N-acetyltransferase n=1 Tax=Dactylosporangium sp. NPDC049742 TaxID=3154737 RepID=UPI00343B9F88